MAKIETKQDVKEMKKIIDHWHRNYNINRLKAKSKRMEIALVVLLMNIVAMMVIMIVIIVG